MEKLDKVIDGLTLCSSENICCAGCPYESLEWCEDQMALDALEIIKVLKAERDFAVRLAQAYGGFVEAALKQEAKDGEAK